MRLNIALFILVPFLLAQEGQKSKDSSHLPRAKTVHERYGSSHVRILNNEPEIKPPNLLLEKQSRHPSSKIQRVYPKSNLTLEEKLSRSKSVETDEGVKYSRKSPSLKYDCHKVPTREALIRQLEGDEVVLGRVIVVLEEGEDRFDPKWMSIVRSLGGSVVKRSVSNSANFLVVELKEATKKSMLDFIEHISNIPGVRYAEPDIKVRTHFEPNDPLWQYQWGPQHINAPDAWDIEIGTMSVSIAIIDQGVQYTHPDLADRFSGLIGYDFVDNDNDPMPDTSSEAHGTHVAGIAAATINNYMGIAGIAGGCRLVSLRGLDETGHGFHSDLADAIYWAADHGFDILNMSWGSQSYSSTIENACNYAWNHGCLLVAASGNDGADSIDYPARLNSVIAVGALRNDGTLCSFSNYGAQQELTAPGNEIASTVPDDSYAYMSGTSMAAPHVSGVAALVWSHNPSLTNQELRDLLDNTADDRGASGWDQYYGYGCVDAFAALSASPVSRELLSDSAVYITQDNDFVYYQSHIYWAAVGVRPDSGSDWDIELYEDTTFTQYLENSALGGNAVDFIVRDYNHAPTGWEGVRVTKWSGDGGATVEYEDGTGTLNIGSQSFPWPAGDVVEIFDIYLTPGTYTFSLTISSGNVDLGIGLYDSYGGPNTYVFDRASLQHYSDHSGAGGPESFAVTIDHTDWFGVIIWANNDDGGQYTINITSGTPGAHLVYSGHIIDDDNSGGSSGDGDGVPEAGETIELPVELSNIGTDTATNVYAILRTSDPDITITDSVENWPDISPGASEWCIYDFDFEISSSAQTHDVEFLLEIHSDQGMWMDTFAITIYQTQPGLVELLSDGEVYITSNQHFFYEQGHIYWAGVGVRPDSGSDWDIKLYEDTLFSNFLEGSYRAGDRVDFVLRDYNHAPEGVEGVYVYRFAGPGGAMVEYEDYIETLYLGLNQDYWDIQDVIEVYDVYLSAGDYRFILDVQNSTLDLGFAFFDSQMDTSTYAFSRIDALASSDTAGLGGDEEFVVHLTHEDWFGVVVWSNNANDGDYAIEIHTVGIEEETGMVSAPHTFNMRVSPSAVIFSGVVSVKLDLPYETKADLKVFDVSGRLVKTVFSDRPLKQGYHTFSLSARPLNSGVYIIRYSDKNGNVKTSKFVVIHK